MSYASPPDADATFDQARLINWGAVARILIAALIVPELIYWSRPLDVAVVGSRGWLLFLSPHLRTFASMFSMFAVAAVIFSWESFRRLIGEELRGPVEAPATRAAFLALHLAAVACLVVSLTTTALSKRLDSAHGPAWFCVGAGLSAIALLSWFAALLPARTWLRWARINPVALLGGTTVAIFAGIVGQYALRIWRPLTASTFWAVELLLRMLGQTTFLEPAAARIGTTHFTVTIESYCSGLEGIGLMSVFVAGYLWFCRRELRFPASLILLPAGVVSIWFLNVVRIAALILIGAWSEQVAIDGFHTVAGWLFYTVAACGIVVVSRRSPIFSRAEPEPRRLAAPNPASVYLAPMLAILLIAMLTRIAGGGFDFLYPLKVIGAAAVLWFYRDRLAEFRRDFSWFALMLGGVVFIEWIVLQRRSDVSAEDLAFATQLGSLPASIASLWLVIRAIGAVVTVPLAEELAFRGYLLRKLVDADFARIDFKHFTLLSFVVSSTLFALLHQQWLAGVIAGMLFAVALYRRGALFDAVIAHSTANAMLAAYVMATHRWSLWN